MQFLSNCVEKLFTNKYSKVVERFCGGTKNSRRTLANTGSRFVDPTMIEKQRQRVERAVADMINDIYKTHFKKMQFDMHVCCADCCSDKRGTLETVQNCIENCSIPLARAQDYLQHELGQFQGQLQHCIMNCSDNIHNKMPPNPSDSELSKYQKQFENCTVECVDSHIRLIPNMMKSIKTVLARGPQPKP